MQLTNNAVQNKGEDYGKFEEGNIISLTQLFEYISNIPEGGDQTSTNLYEKFWASCIKLIKDSLLAVKGKLKQHKYTFELLGYDFILD